VLTDCIYMHVVAFPSKYARSWICTLLQLYIILSELVYLDACEVVRFYFGLSKWEGFAFTVR
jgi:hypothetical protein